MLNPPLLRTHKLRKSENTISRQTPETDFHIVRLVGWLVVVFFFSPSFLWHGLLCEAHRCGSPLLPRSCSLARMKCKCVKTEEYYDLYSNLANDVVRVLAAPGLVSHRFRLNYLSTLKLLMNGKTLASTFIQLFYYYSIETGHHAVIYIERVAHVDSR